MTRIGRRLATSACFVGTCFVGLLAGQEQTTAVTGQVVDAHGAAAVGAVVELWRSEELDLRWLDGEQGAAFHRVGVTRTDGDGHFGLQGPLGLLCQLRIDHPASALHRQTVRPAGGRLRVPLPPPCTLHGMVLDAVGTALIARIAVSVDGRDWISTSTDARGRYRLERLPPGHRRIVVEAAAAVAPAHAWLTLVPGQEVVHSPVLQRGATVTGRAIDAATGTPVAGAEVGIGWWNSHRVRTDAEGTFTIAGFGGDRSAVHCLANGYRRSIWLPHRDARGTCEFRLDRGTTVRGIVRDEAGRPLSGATVWTLGVESSTQTYFHFVNQGSTDANGGYRLSGNGHDEMVPTVVATAPGRAMVVREGEHKGSDLRMPPLTLPPGRLLCGTAVGATGQPASGIQVLLWGGNDDRWNSPRSRSESRRGGGRFERMVGWRSASTDGEGRFAFGALAPGTYDLEFRDAAGKQIELLLDLVVGAVDPAPLQVDLPR